MQTRSSPLVLDGYPGRPQPQTGSSSTGLFDNFNNDWKQKNDDFKDVDSSLSLDSVNYDDHQAKFIRSTSRVLLILVASILATAALGLGILVIVDTKWLTYTFTGLQNDVTSLQQYNRTRGMFRICKTTGTANCTYIDFGFNANADWNYYSITGLELAHVALFIIGVILIFNVLAITIISQILLSLTKYSYRAYVCIYTMLAIILIVSVFCTGSSTILFDVTMGEEETKNTTSLNYAYAQWSNYEKANTVFYRDYNYALAWVVCWLTLIAAILYFVTVCVDLGTSTRAKRHQKYLIRQDSVSEALGFHKDMVFDDLASGKYIKSTGETNFYGSQSAPQSNIAVELDASQPPIQMTNPTIRAQRF